MHTTAQPLHVILMEQLLCVLYRRVLVRRYKRVSDADHVHRDICVLEADEAAWEIRK